MGKWGRAYRRGNKWWIAYYVRGEEIRESAGDTRRDALAMLDDRFRSYKASRFADPKVGKMSVADVLDDLLAHAERVEMKSLAFFQSHCRTLKARIGHMELWDITERSLVAYQDQRLKDGVQRSTINREVGVLRQAMRRHRQALGGLPRFPRFSEKKNVRQGFCDYPTVQRIMAQLAEPFADFVEFTYLTGWRRSEVDGLQWSQVDRGAGEIKLPDTKSGLPRTLPLVGRVAELIEKRWRLREFRTRRGTRHGLSPYVFHWTGKPIGPFKVAWRDACAAAGVPALLLHDLRRSSARNLIRAGVPQTVAMRIIGHETDSMFRRYDITSDTDKVDALGKLEQYYAGQVSTLVLMKETVKTDDDQKRKADNTRTKETGSRPHRAANSPNWQAPRAGLEPATDRLTVQSEAQQQPARTGKHR